MINLLNKSVKSIYHNFSSQEPRPMVDILKLTYLSIKDNYQSLSLILLINNNINVYILENEPVLTFKLIFTNTFNFKINLIEPINYITKFNNDLPILSLVSNSSILFENQIKLYSINHKKVIHVIRNKYNILQVLFRKKYFGVSSSNGKIYLYDNKTLNLLYRIGLYDIKVAKPQNENVNVYNCNPTVSMTIERQVGITTSMEQCNLNDYVDSKIKCQSVMMNKASEQKMENKKNCFSYNIAFDMTDSFITYSIHKKEKIKIQNNQDNEEGNNLSPFESFALEAYKNFSKLKEWSFKSISEYNSLLKSKNSKSNNELNSSSVSVNVFNITSPSDDLLPYKLSIPFFQGDINTIFQIQNGKYIIIGNNYNQMFYIYELYPQTNQKYNSALNYSSNKYKIIYSLFRGMRACQLSAIDISDNLEYSLITSNRGTNHVFYLPKRDNIISEDVDNFTNPNDDLLSMKIVNAEEINKFSYKYYNSGNGKSIYAAKFVNLDKVTIENNFTEENGKKINELIKNKFTQYIENGNYLIMVNDNIVNICLLLNKSTFIPLKTIKLNLNEEAETISIYYNQLMRTATMSNNLQEQIKKNDNILSELSLDSPTTDVSNFSVYQLNPLFTFNSFTEHKTFKEYIKETQIQYIILKGKLIFLKTKNDIINYEYDEDNEIVLYELLCNDNEYSKLVNTNEKRKRSDINDTVNSKKIIINPSYEVGNSLDVNNNFYNNKDSILEDNIKNAMSTNIKDFIKTKNTVDLKDKIIIQENYYK